MDLSPVKSEGFSSLPAKKSTRFSRSSCHEDVSVDSDAFNLGNDLVHPALDGTNARFRGPQQPTSSSSDKKQPQGNSMDNSASLRSWNPSESDFVEAMNSSKRRSHYLMENAFKANEEFQKHNGHAIESKTSTSNNDSFKSCDEDCKKSSNDPTSDTQTATKDTVYRNPKDDDTTDDASSTDDTPLVIPTLDTYQPPEPSYTKANALPFHTLCKRLEAVWKQRRVTGRKAVSKTDKLQYLLPDSLLRYLEGGSPYPYLRLLCPDHDSSRPHTGLKEATVAKVWGDAMGLMAHSNAYRKLTHYRDPEYNGATAGDLSVVVQQLTEERYGSGSRGKGSNLTVGEVNDWLDVLVDIVKDRFDMATSEREGNSGWKESLKRAIAGDGRAGKKMKKHDKYVKLLEKLISKNLSVSLQ